MASSSLIISITHQSNLFGIVIVDTEMMLPVSSECNIRIVPSSAREFQDPESVLVVCLKAVIFLSIPLSLSA